MNWKIVISFTYPHEAHLAKTKLESEGIEVIIRDELTAQINNFNSNAIGGVKLLVLENKYEKAIDVLKTSGYINEKNQSQKIKKTLVKIDKITSRIPIIGKLILEFRIIISITFILMALIFSIVILTMPTLEEQITKNSWCVDMLLYKGKQYYPNTLGLKLMFNDECTETFNFDNDGTINLPGFNSNSVYASWKIERDKIVIYNSDTLSHLYEGEYVLNIKNGRIKIQSEKTTIIGHTNGVIW